MEALFVHLMQWGKQQGYHWFALGMAPLSGFERSPVAPLWNRIGAFLYEHGEAVYNFQGLRAYKEKFNPIWEPHYLAYPGGLRLAAHPGRRLGAGRRWIPTHLSQVSTRQVVDLILRQITPASVGNRPVAVDGAPPAIPAR